MHKLISFTKMHGAGNDYIYVDADACPVENPEKLAVRWSTPHTGIGADGLVLISRSDVADFRMRIFNADGSEALMCGNASRCIGKYVYDNCLTRQTHLTLETPSGIRELQLLVENGAVDKVTVEMGVPQIENEALMIGIPGRGYTGVKISVGNPHFVILTGDLAGIDLDWTGPEIENHPVFAPGRTNVEFVEIINPGEIRMRVWERGSGITMACGTGACAAAVACILKRKTRRTVRVHMDGGALDIQWDETTGKIHMTGDAVHVFDGVIAL